MNLDLESEPLEVGFGQPGLSQSWACGPVGLVTGPKLALGLAGEAEAEGRRSRVGLVCVGCQRGLSLGPSSSSAWSQADQGGDTQERVQFEEGALLLVSGSAPPPEQGTGPPALSLSPSQG